MTTTLDQIIDEALANARTKAVEAVFARVGDDSDIALRPHVLDYLKSPGQARIIELADKAIAALNTPKPRNSY